METSRLQITTTKDALAHHSLVLRFARCHQAAGAGRAQRARSSLIRSAAFSETRLPTRDGKPLGHLAGPRQPPSARLLSWWQRASEKGTSGEATSDCPSEGVAYSRDF
ncbi:hypothetical protein [Haladaptatus litoreus]|uniref:hypothetical protein n=1 Tax=Haladaptatus litoreus TaxID=553468 RepID=UPI0009711253|nr:hypothetical protein [Haladaptatus litoreus]